MILWFPSDRTARTQTPEYSVEDVYGEFVLETEGDPVTLNDLEESASDADCKALIEAIRSVIADPGTYWEPCSKEDEQYISDWLDIWGIAHN